MFPWRQSTKSNLQLSTYTLLLKFHIQMFPIILMPFNTLKFNKFVQFHS